jgi:hypothetical protein
MLSDDVSILTLRAAHTMAAAEKQLAFPAVAAATISRVAAADEEHVHDN